MGKVRRKQRSIITARHSSQEATMRVFLNRDLNMHAREIHTILRARFRCLAGKMRCCIIGQQGSCLLVQAGPGGQPWYATRTHGLPLDGETQSNNLHGQAENHQSARVPSCMPGDSCSASLLLSVYILVKHTRHQDTNPNPKHYQPLIHNSLRPAQSNPPPQSLIAEQRQAHVQSSNCRYHDRHAA